MSPVKKISESYRLLLIFFGALILALLVFTLMQTSKKSELVKTSVIFASIEKPEEVLIHADSIVVPIVYENIPEIREMSPQKRKMYFIHILLPSILLVREEMEENRKWVANILKDSVATAGMTDVDSIRLSMLLEDFNTDDPEELMIRLHTHPTSMALAQAAIETGWGRSRFCKQANNLFGIWSFNSAEPRMAASQDREGKTIYVRKYDNIYQSVRDYYVMMGRAPAFSKFRYHRRRSQNPYELIWFLKKYSEKRLEYVVMLRNVIANNQLTRYDHYQLAPYKMDTTLRTYASY
ncbi:MAG TPA: hypothetical protein DDY13_17365 [Cytophagales bacterium]|jgi:Bax protein|nr:hypothetical protein [Cytophagales bacterium]